ncbi:MAG: hypothetical protein V3V10_05885 [Planctomycetota bacterium]
MPVSHKTLRTKVFARVKALYGAGRLAGAPSKWGGSRGAFAFINKLVSKQIADVDVTTKQLNAFLAKVEKAVRVGKLKPAKGARKVVKAGKAAAKKTKTTKLVKKAKAHAKKTGARAKQQVKARAKSVKKAAKGNRRVSKLNRKVAKKSRTSTREKKTTASTRLLVRSKSVYPTARAAWKVIAELTGLKSEQVTSEHTDKYWRWKPRNSVRAAKNTSPKPAPKKTKTAVKKKRAVKASKLAAKAKRVYHKAAKAGHRAKPKDAIFVMLETSLGRVTNKGRGLAVVKWRPSLIEISGSAVIDVSKRLEKTGKAMVKRLWFKRIGSDRVEAMELKGKQITLGPVYLIKTKRK